MKECVWYDCKTQNLMHEGQWSQILKDQRRHQNCEDCYEKCINGMNRKIYDIDIKIECKHSFAYTFFFAQLHRLFDFDDVSNQ